MRPSEKSSFARWYFCSASVRSASAFLTSAASPVSFSSPPPPGGARRAWICWRPARLDAVAHVDVDLFDPALHLGAHRHLLEREERAHCLDLAVNRAGDHGHDPGPYGLRGAPRVRSEEHTS